MKTILIMTITLTIIMMQGGSRTNMVTMELYSYSHRLPRSLSHGRTVKEVSSSKTPRRKMRKHGEGFVDVGWAGLYSDLPTQKMNECHLKRDPFLKRKFYFYFCKHQCSVYILAFRGGKPGCWLFALKNVKKYTQNIPVSVP